jgi:recombination protein RecA
MACPWSAAEAWEVLLALCRSDALDLILATLPDLLALRGAGGGRYRPARVLGRLALALRGRQTALLLTNRPLLPCPDAETPAWPTIGGAAIARAATLRLALRPAGVRVTPYGDVAALSTYARVIRQRGRPLGIAVPLEIAAGGPRRAAELLALGCATGCLERTALGVAVDGQVLGRTDARAVQALDADPGLAAELERRIRAAWAARRGQPVGDGVTRS